MNFTESKLSNPFIRIALARPWWSWALLPSLAIVMAIVWSLDLQAPHESTALLHFLNIFFISGVGFLISFASGRGFLRFGELSHLLLGTGAFCLGIGSVVAVLYYSPQTQNFAITVHNLCFWIFGCCQLAGILTSSQPRRIDLHRGPKLGMAYAGIGLLCLAFAVAAWNGWTPVFFRPGQGGTLLRLMILGSATVMIGIASFLLWKSYLRAASPFAYYYAMGLALMALGLAAVTAVSISATAMGWFGRIAQYAGAVYLFAGVVARGWDVDTWEVDRQEPRLAQRTNVFITSLQDPSPRRHVLRYGFALFGMLVALAIHRTASAWVGPGLPPYIFFYPSVILVAILAGTGPGIVATLLAAVLASLWISPAANPMPPAPVGKLGAVLFVIFGVSLGIFAEFYRQNRRKAAIYDQEVALLQTRKDKDFLANILENASQPFAVGFLNGRMGIFNRAFANLTEYSTEELKSVDWLRTLTPSEFREVEAERLEECLRTGQPVRYEKHLLTKNGNQIPVEVLIHVVRPLEGEPDSFYFFLTDVSERKKAEALLQRYELLAQHTRDILLFVEKQTGRILEANPAAEAAYGYSREELLKLSILDLRASSTLTHLATHMEQADANGAFFESVHQRKDGKTFPVEVHSVGATIGGSRLLLSTIRDITHRKVWEDALQESESTLRALLDATQESIWLFDTEGNILAANRTALQRIKKGADEVIGAHFSRFMSPEVASTRSATLEKVKATGQVVTHEDERSGYIFDHTFYPVQDAEGRVHRVATFSRNITTIRRSEMEMKKTNGRIRLLAESARELLSSDHPREVMESLCHTVMEFLDCQVFFNYMADEAGTKFHLDVFAGIDEEEAKAIEWLPYEPGQCLCDRSDVGPFENRAAADHRCLMAHLVKDKGILAFDCRPLIAEGKMLGIFAIGARNRAHFSEDDLGLIKAIADQVSLTMQRVASKEALQRMNEALSNANLLLEHRVTERTRELNTRMVQLKTLTLQLNRAEEEERRRIAQVIHDHLQQLLVAARINVDTLSYRTTDEMTLQRLKSLNNILVESIHVSRSLTAELYPSVLHAEGLTAALHWLANWYMENHGLGVEMAADVQIDIPELDMRIMAFRTVRELLFNVVKHAGVNTARVQLNRIDSNSLMVTVSDGGAGFDPESVLKADGTKTGFGLFTLRQRIELFGGAFEIQSAPSQGTQITVTLPIASRPLSIQEPEALPPLINPGQVPSIHGKLSKVRILLADDHPVVREGLAQMLKEEADFEIISQASNGLEAVEEARRWNPDVIIIDVAMPVMGGIEATRRILAEQPHIKILGLSMYDDESHAELMREAGAVAFLDKSGPFAILKDQIREHAGVTL